MPRRAIHRALFSAAAFFVASSAFAPPSATLHAGSERAASTPRPLPEAAVVLLALDGVRWQEIFHGVDPSLARAQGLAAREIVGARELLPNLHALMTRDGAAVGAPGSGAEMVASGPHFVSLPGYAEILTGHRQSGCRDNECRRAERPTLLDDLVRELRLAPAEVASVTSWGPIARVAARDLDRAAVSSGRTPPSVPGAFTRDAALSATLRAGASASPAPGHGDFRPDRYTADIALRYLDTQRPRFLFVGLGEPDEYGHRNDYRGYLRALRFADGVAAELSRVLAAWSAAGTRTLLLVTTDHGRARRFVDHGSAHPESARVWLVASGSGVRARGPVGSGRTRRLADIAPTVRRALGLPVRGGAGAGEPLLELFDAREASAPEDPR